MKGGYKLVIIGGGSVYTPEVFNEIIARWEKLPIREIVLVDVEEGEEKARIIRDFGRRMFAASGIACELSFALDRKTALEDADFVINQIRAGHMAARSSDEMLGIELGIIGQETTGVGGFSNALRTIPVAIEIARDMEQCCPQAWLINFANPAGIVTEALLKNSGVRCVGLCNVPINMKRDIAKVLGVPKERVDCRFVGLNHLSFVTQVRCDGKDVLAQVIDGINGDETLMKNIPKVQGVGELTKQLGVIPSPYLQYYYFEKQMLHKQMDEWNQHSVTRAAKVTELNDGIFAKYADVSVCVPPAELAGRGGSLYSFEALNVIEALTGDQDTEMIVNAFNCGAVVGLEDDDVVETNCIVNKRGVSAIPFGRLPDSIAGLVKTVKQYERLTIEAATEGDKQKAFWALLNHPLAHGFENAQTVLDRVSELRYMRWRQEGTGIDSDR